MHLILNLIIWAFLIGLALWLIQIVFSIVSMILIGVIAGTVMLVDWVTKPLRKWKISKVEEE